MTRRGWRRMDSIAVTTFGIGACSSGLEANGAGEGCPAGTPASAGAGMRGGVFGSFIILVRLVLFRTRTNGSVRGTRFRKNSLEVHSIEEILPAVPVSR